VRLVQAVPRGALSAYSSFLEDLLRVALENLPRGVVHTAVKKAELVSVQETSLREWLTRLRIRVYATWSKTNTPTSRTQPLSVEGSEAQPTKKAAVYFFDASKFKAYYNWAKFPLRIGEGEAVVWKCRNSPRRLAALLWLL